MPSPEEERFRPFLDRYRWRIVHEPHMAHSFLVFHTDERQPELNVAVLHLPYRRSDATRMSETAIYIALTVLRRLRLVAGDPRATSVMAAVGLQHVAEQIAPRLIVPRPWIEAHVAAHGAGLPSLRQAARRLSVPLASIRTVLATPSSPTATAVHQTLRATVGFPWFLPPELRDRFDPDCW